MSLVNIPGHVSGLLFFEDGHRYKGLPLFCFAYPSHTFKCSWVAKMNFCHDQKTRPFSRLFLLIAYAFRAQRSPFPNI